MTQTSRSSKGIKVEWFKHLPGAKDQEEFKKLVRSSNLVLQRLWEILNEREQAILTKEASETDYNDSSWSHKQAHRNGRREEIKALKDLVSFVTNEE